MFFRDGRWWYPIDNSEDKMTPSDQLEQYMRQHKGEWFSGKELQLLGLVPASVIYRSISKWHAEGKIVKSTPGKPLYKWIADA
jgi:hypothetical protein